MISIQLYICSYHSKVILESIVVFVFVLLACLYFYFEGLGFRSYFSNVEHIGIKLKGPQTIVLVNKVAISCHSWEIF